MSSGSSENQFALPMLGDLMWTQQWPMDRQMIDRERRGEGQSSAQMYNKATKGAVRPHCSEDPAINMRREFRERTEKIRRRSMIKEEFRFEEELGVELNLKHPRSVKRELRKCQVEKLEEGVRNQRWHEV